MKNTSVFGKKITWSDFAACKVWKKSLRRHSKKTELSESMLTLMKQYFPGFLKTSEKNPDELIEEALIDAEISR